MFAEFDKVVRCLALELPESVHADVVAKYGKLKAEVKKFTSTNTCVMPLPTLDECVYMAVSADSGEGAFQHDCAIVKKVYDFIGRQQHNT